MQKAAAYVSSLGQVEERKEHKQIIEQIYILLKSAETPTLRAVKSILEGKSEPGEGQRLQRAVRQLGGSATVAIPNYVVEKCLAEVMATTKTVVSSFSGEDRRNAFLFGVGATPETLVPERKGLVSDFVAWYVERYNMHGKRFQQCKIEQNMELDWVEQLGYYQLLSKSSGVEAFDSLYCRLSGEVVPLPKGLLVPKAALGASDGFELCCNWLVQAAKLVDHSAGCEFLLCKQFPKMEEADMKQWDPLRCDGFAEVPLARDSPLGSLL